MKSFLLALLAVTVFVLHQDFWNWNRYDPLIFGFLPLGLAYHAMFSILCAITMAIFVKHAWPAHLEELENHRTPGGDAEA
jgi:hypothetical protein